LVAFTEYPIELIQSGEHEGEFQNVVNQEMSELWYDATDGAGFIVKGTAFDGNYKEIIKYIAKGVADMDKKRLQELATWSKGKRMLFTTGKLYANKELKELMNDETEDKIDSRACPDCGCNHAEMSILQFNHRLGNYVLEESPKHVEFSSDGRIIFTDSQ
jgi:hypothetical protein